MHKISDHWISDGNGNNWQRVSTGFLQMQKLSVETEGCNSQQLIPPPQSAKAFVCAVLEGLPPFTRHYIWTKWEDGWFFILVGVLEVLLHLLFLVHSPAFYTICGWYYNDNDEFGAVGGMRISRGNWSTQRKPVPSAPLPFTNPLFQAGRSWGSSATEIAEFSF
jgi:hypothetical protein